MSKKDKESHPIVFISYSHDSREHADKVLGFANKLRSEGIDAIIDQYGESPSEGWPKWMDKQIQNSDFILMVCTEGYYSKVMGTVKRDEGLGVKWESTLAYQDLYNAGGQTKRYIPVLFKDGKREYIPKPLGGATYYCVEAGEGYEGLYRRLTRQPKTKRPALGKLKSLEERKPKTNFFAETGGVDEDEEMMSGGSVNKEGTSEEIGKLKSLGERKPKTNFFADTGGGVDKDEGMMNAGSVNKEGTSAEIRSMSEKLYYKLYYIVGILASLAVIFSVFLWYRQYKMPKPPLKATVVDCGRWKAPFYVEEELKGMQQVGYACKSFKEIMPDDDTFKKTFMVVHEFSSEIISEIERLEPCEADNVKRLKSIYCILVKNDGSKICEDLKIIFKGAKYIEFKKEGEARKRFRDLILVEMGDLDSSVTIEIDVWATCPSGKKPEFKITSRGRPADVYFN